MNLQDKVAIVSGGARDIGRAVSVKLAAEGAKVIEEILTRLKSGLSVVEVAQFIVSPGLYAPAVQ